MTGEQKIRQALLKKGYVLREAYFEAISYGREGRYGGWYVEIDEDEETEEITTGETWDKLQLPNGVIGAYMPYAFICYNLKDAMKMIEGIPFNSRTTKQYVIKSL